MTGTDTFVTGDHLDHLRMSTNVEHFDNMKLKINGHDRFSPRNAVYFRTIQPIQANHNIQNISVALLQ